MTKKLFFKTRTWHDEYQSSCYRQSSGVGVTTVARRSLSNSYLRPNNMSYWYKQIVSAHDTARRRAGSLINVLRRHVYVATAASVPRQLCGDRRLIMKLQWPLHGWKCATEYRLYRYWVDCKRYLCYLRLYLERDKRLQRGLKLEFGGDLCPEVDRIN